MIDIFYMLAGILAMLRKNKKALRPRLDNSLRASFFSPPESPPGAGLDFTRLNFENWKVLFRVCGPAAFWGWSAASVAAVVLAMILRY